MKTLFRISKWIHKYIGLFLILFLFWMSISGLLLNHPNLIGAYTVPDMLTPPLYKVKNWNRSAMTEHHILKSNPSIRFASGNFGVWKSIDSSKTFTPFGTGFPTGAMDKKTADLLLIDGAEPALFAATNAGLYRSDIKDGKWHYVPIKKNPFSIHKVMHIKGWLWVFSTSRVYKAAYPAAELNFVEQILPGKKMQAKQVSMLTLFSKLHDGSIWGLPGRLIFDAVAIILAFLSLSAFYSWYYPWRKKRRKKAPSSMGKGIHRLYKWFFKYHLSLGIWSALFLFIIGFTGFFLRPPQLAIIASKTIPATWYRAPISTHPWAGQLQNVTYDASAETFIIESSKGYYKADISLNKPFELITINTPVFVMGTTYLDAVDSTRIRVGSFNGIFEWHRLNKTTVDMETGLPPKNVSSFKSAKNMVTGMWQMDSLSTFLATHNNGIVPLDSLNNHAYFTMPDRAYFKMPLWNWLFELHNGRLFKDWVGGLYILIIPVGALFFILITLSGVYDWLFVKKLRKIRR